jgi:hypothetical protein
MNAAAIFLAVSLLSGCASVGATPGTNGGVKLGEVQDLGGLRLRPDRVIEDSRCPIGVKCVWAGRVVLRATLIGRQGTRSVDLTLGSPAQGSDGALTLVAVEPQRAPVGLPETQHLRFRFEFRPSR